MRKRLGAISVAILVMCLSVPGQAQVATGNIGGQVEDSSGALIPQAKITLTHSATRAVRSVVTNERGEFLAPLLAIGEYEVAAEFTGFKRSTFSGIRLAVDQTVMLPIRLDPGSVTENVDVKATAPLLNTENSSLGQVIENHRVVELPLNGRNVFSLGLLSGNTTEVSGIGSNQTFAAGGGRFSGNEILLDGISNNTTSWNGSIGRNSVLYTPSVDAVEEFKVKTSTFSAEFGHSAGAVVSATIKSGTNNMHGALFEFLRNDKLDANNFFSNAAGLQKSPFRQNQFGFALGGPIYLPKLYDGHNRTFFFLDYQGTRKRTRAGSQIYDLAPLAFRSGDFSALGRPVYDPLSRRIGPAGAVISDPFPSNQIPSIRQNPTSLQIETQIPAPNFGAPGALARNFFASPRQQLDGNQFDARIDQKLSQFNTIFARFSLSNVIFPNPGIFPGPLGAGSTQLQYGRHGVINDVHVFSPSVINEFRFGFTRANGSAIGEGRAGAAFAKQVNLSLFPTPVQGFPSMTFSPTGQISGQTLFSGFGGGSTNLNIERVLHWVDNVTVIRGNHAVKVGADVRRNYFDNLIGGFGTYIFGSIFSSSSNDPGSGNPWADFLMGFPALQNPSTTMLAWGQQRSIYAGAFAQDDWKITRRLTLNLGLRYDLYTQPVDANDLGGMYSFELQQFVQPGKNGFSRAIVRGYHKNFSPRVGLAYQISRRLVMRSGYGIFYGLRDQNDQTTIFSENIPNVPTLVNPTITATGTVLPPISVNTPIVFTPQDPTLSAFSAQRPAAFTIQTVDFNNVPFPYLQQWNYSLQYELSSTWLLEAAYSGSKGTHLGARNNLGQVPFEYALQGKNTQAFRSAPKINGTGGISSGDANNKYQAVSFKLEKRYAKGFNLLVNYTISKNLETNGSGDSSYSQNGNTSLPLYAFDRRRDNGPSPLDIPQRFVASYAYELPFGKGKSFLNRGGFLDRLAGGWQVNGISTLRGGFPTDVRVSVVPPTFATFNVPDRVSGVDMYAHQGVDQYLNPAAFRVPGTVLSYAGVPIQMFGNSARHVARGPGSVNTDLSIFKNTRVTERMALQFRAEMFNVTNTPTFFLASASSTTLSVGSAAFGKLTNGTAVGRQIQFGLKLLF
ncbi:MAG TPA: TonB-dependent receptor [Bryobacteraceae bacterium]|nr:TonB-dependent receptor [Bryobacteraceae bacterium]